VIGYLTQNYSLIHAFQPRPARRSRSETLALNRVFKLAPKLSDYFRDGEIVAVKGEPDRPISGLAVDSRRVVPGNLFFALPGRHADGATFIDEAVSRGAVAIVVQKMPSCPPAKVTFIRVADTRKTLALVAQRYYKFPDRDMTVIGVTGTNGKTTVAHLLKHLLNGDQRVGLLGTISYDLGARTVPSYRTTPEALDERPPRLPPDPGGLLRSQVAPLHRRHRQRTEGRRGQPRRRPRRKARRDDFGRSAPRPARDVR
jgi:UDP-N-acetylmuramoyl-L-alanyl-D-glutamate--2,6-diaminopimelate ligase